MNSYSFDNLEKVYQQPFFDLIQQARNVFLQHWQRNEIQLCTLLSIKTGGCSEDCAYCAQSARYQTGVEAERLMSTEEILEVARNARANGSTRFCMGAAWKGIREGTSSFNSVLETVRAVSQLGMEVCVTLGELTDEAAQQLKDAGVTAYNHNLDTSREFYGQIITTHTFQDRLNTIGAVQRAGMSVCCGGIIGMGESVADRLRMLEELTKFDPPPESVPINCLMAMPGTPLEDQPPVDVFALARLVATTRIALPQAKVRLSAGRTSLSREGQALCFFAGANSIFYGNKLLTAQNPEADADHELLRELGLVPQQPFSDSVTAASVLAR
ncbi:MAG TPA: biotin synthase BioB [Verrucomicrobiae bacterium]|nr:biotin synthase BioB [Verrucomicrobiae bacterium]